MRFVVTFFILISTFRVSAFSGTECLKPVQHIYAGQGISRIFVKHGGEHGNSRMTMVEADNNENIVNQVMSILLAAQVADKPVIFRYASPGADCTTTSTQNFIGVWIAK